MTEPMIEAGALVKRFGSATALAGIDLAAEKGTTLALLGPNGAGKTTLVRILTTLLKPDSGRTSVAGYDVTADPGPVRSAIGLAGQYAAVDELLTGRENLELAGLLYHLGRAERRRRAQQALERFSLTGAGDQLVKTYSGGMRRQCRVVKPGRRASTGNGLVWVTAGLVSREHGGAPVDQGIARSPWI